MKHIKDYKIFEEGKIGGFFRNNQIMEICQQYNITNYTINSDESIDVDNNVDLYNRGLVGLPLKFNRVNGVFTCAQNKLTSLEGCPNYVGGNFGCSSNKLISLEGCPKYVGGDFFCYNNGIISLEGCPEHVSGAFSCFDNPMYIIVGHFIKKENKNDLIELFNYCDIIQGWNVIYDRLEYFFSEIGIEITNNMLESIKFGGYKIIR